MENTVNSENNNNEKIIIKNVTSIGTTPIIPLFMKEFAKLIEQGYAANNMVGSNRSRAIYAEVNGEIAGFIVFEIQEDVAKTCWIIFGTVLEPYRRKGLYKTMYSHLEKLVKQQGSTQVVSLVHIDNHAMLELNKQLDRHPVFYRVEKNI